MMLRSSSIIRSEKLHRKNCPMSILMVSPSLSGAVVRTVTSPTLMGRSASITSSSPTRLS